MNGILRSAASVLMTICAAGSLEGCGGRGAIGSSQVIVHLEDNRDVAGATVVAQETCGRRGGRARLIAVTPGGMGSGGRLRSPEPRQPDAVFECDLIR